MALENVHCHNLVQSQRSKLRMNVNDCSAAVIHLRISAYCMLVLSSTHHQANTPRAGVRSPTRISARVYLEVVQRAHATARPLAPVLDRLIAQDGLYQTTEAPKASRALESASITRRKLILTDVDRLRAILTLRGSTSLLHERGTVRSTFDTLIA